jgi:hypothetical protein
MNDRKEKKKNEFYIHPYITNGYYIAFASHPHYFRFSFFLYSVKKRREKKRNRERKCPLIHTFIMEFRCCKLLLFTLLPFVPFLLCCLRHDVYSICSVLSFWYSPLLTTTIRYARIIISTFYTHTFFIFSSYNTLGCAFVLMFFFVFFKVFFFI